MTIRHTPRPRTSPHGRAQVAARRRRHRTILGERCQRNTVVTLTGDLDFHTTTRPLDILTRALHGSASVCCDLSNVGFFGAAGAGVLLAAQRYATAHGRTFSVRGAHGLTACVLALSDPDGLITRHP